MNLLRAIRDAFRLPSQVERGLQRASQDIRDHPAPPPGFFDPPTDKLTGARQRDPVTGRFLPRHD